MGAQTRSQAKDTAVLNPGTQENSPPPEPGVPGGESTPESVSDAGKNNSQVPSAPVKNENVDGTSLSSVPAATKSADGAAESGAQSKAAPVPMEKPNETSDAGGRSDSTAEKAEIDHKINDEIDRILKCPENSPAVILKVDHKATNDESLAAMRLSGSIIHPDHCKAPHAAEAFGSKQLRITLLFPH